MDIPNRIGGEIDVGATHFCCCAAGPSCENIHEFDTMPTPIVIASYINVTATLEATLGCHGRILLQELVEEWMLEWSLLQCCWLVLTPFVGYFRMK
jgi:hypothetical protein